MFLYYIGATLLALSLVLHIIGIGTARFSYSDEFKSFTVMHKAGRVTTEMGTVDREIQYGLFRLCTDACLYVRKNDYKCDMEVNTKTTSELQMLKLSKKMLCYNLVPAESEEMYGDNQVIAPGWLIAAQGLCITGVFVSILAGFIIVIILQLINKSRGGEQAKTMFTTYATILAATFIAGGVISIIGDIVYGTQHVRLVFWDPDGEEEYYDDQTSEVQDMYDDMFELSWGFWIDVSGGILSIIAGVLVAVGVFSHGAPKKTIGQGFSRSP